MRHLFFLAPALALTWLIFGAAMAQTSPTPPAQVAPTQAPTAPESPQRPQYAAPVAQPRHTLDLRIRANSDDVMLATTVYLPRGPGPFPLLVIAHGAGTASRNQPGWKNAIGPIVEAGIAVAAYDDRGTGDTPGEWAESRPLPLETSDLSDVVDFLSHTRGIRADRIGVIGWSRGGWTGPMAAARNPKIRFIAAISAPSVSPNDANIFQRGQELIDQGYSEDEVEEIDAMRRVVWRYYGTGRGYEQAREVWLHNVSRPWFARLGLGPEPRRPDELSDSGFDYYRDGAFDPAPLLSSLHQPILVMLGDADRHIPIDASLSGWRRAFAASGNRDATIVVFPKTGHAMRLLDGPEPLSSSSYAAVAAAPMNPSYMPTLLTWLRRQTN